METMKTKNPVHIIADIEWKYNLKSGTLSSRKSSKFISKARREAILRLREIGMSFPEIGEYLKRAHSSVMRLVAPVEKPVEKSGISGGKHGDKKREKKKSG